VALCNSCTNRLLAGKAIGYFVPTEEEPLPPPEERFEELFKVARVLLKEGVTEEAQIIPSLAFANEIGQRVLDLIDMKERLVAVQEDPKAWRVEAEKFTQKHPGLRPIRVVDGIVILERLPVSVHIHSYPGTEDEAPREVAVTLYPHPRLASPEHVAAFYEKTLSIAGIACEEQRRAYMGFEFSKEGYLIMSIERSDVPLARKRAGIVLRGREPRFPHPIVVREYYRMLLGRSSGNGSARHLTMRKRGRDPEADTLIPACVAFYLRNYGEIESRKEIHHLLNEHVLCESWKTLPIEGYSSSETTQLWRDVKKVKNRLLSAAYALYR
jgi:hypothetical protein